MTFSVEKRFFELFPGLSVGFLVVEGEIHHPSKDPFKLLKDASERVKEKVSKPQELPEIKAWREAFKKVGIQASKFYSSVEALLRRCIKGEIPGPIHPLVDLYNAFSIENLVPVGGHDLEKVEEYIKVSFAKGGEEFVTFSGNVEKVPAGEPIYRDKKGVLTRRWVWRQSSRDLIGEETRKVFMPVDVLHPSKNPERLVEDLKNTVQDYFRNVDISLGVVNRLRNTMPI